MSKPACFPCSNLCLVLLPWHFLDTFRRCTVAWNIILQANKNDQNFNCNIVPGRIGTVSRNFRELSKLWHPLYGSFRRESNSDGRFSLTHEDKLPVPKAMSLNTDDRSDMTNMKCVKAGQFSIHNVFCDNLFPPSVVSQRCLCRWIFRALLRTFFTTGISGWKTCAINNKS